jgi:hypothetical protein
MVSDVKVFMGSSYFNNVVNELFNGDYTQVTHMRNMAHMSVAPTGSLSNTSLLAAGEQILVRDSFDDLIKL